MLFDFNFCMTYMYIQNCVHIIFKIWYNSIIVSYFLLCAVHFLMQGFVYEKIPQGNQNYSQDRSFFTENEENPALVLSSVLNRTSARDGLIFGSMGLSMYTTSLRSTISENTLTTRGGGRYLLSPHLSKLAATIAFPANMTKITTCPPPHFHSYFSLVALKRDSATRFSTLVFLYLMAMIHSYKSTSNSLQAHTITHRGSKFRLLAYITLWQAAWTKEI